MREEIETETPSTEIRDVLTDRVLRLAADQVAIPADQVSLDSAFVNDLGFDSLDQVEFLMEIEDAFNVSVPADAVERILTVRQAADEVRRLTESQSGTK